MAIGKITITCNIPVELVERMDRAALTRTRGNRTAFVLAAILAQVERDESRAKVKGK